MIRQVRLEMARCPEFPEGSSYHGYELSIPLTRGGRLDPDAWLKHRAETGFRRFWAGEEERGQLRHDRRGWTLAFEAGGDADEVIFKGDAHRFTAGEYVSIKERDGITRTFHIAAVH
jgi:hypothetical protein